MIKFALATLCLVCLSHGTALACQETEADVWAYQKSLREADVVVIGTWESNPAPKCANSGEQCTARVIVESTERGVSRPEYLVPYKPGLPESLCDGKGYGLPDGWYGRFYLDRNVDDDSYSLTASEAVESDD